MTRTHSKLSLTTTLLTAFVSGCAAPYIAPPRENNSVLMFSVPDLRAFFFHLNGENCTDTVRISSDDNPLQNATKSLIIPSNKQVALTLLWQRPGSNNEVWNCLIALSFKLEPNKSYELIGRYEGNICNAAIVDWNRSDNPDARSRINLIPMKYPKTAASIMFGQSGSICEPKAASDSIELISPADRASR